MSIFRELLSIKAFREGQAQVVLQKAQAQVVHARRELDARQAALEAFQARARQLEAQWYAQLCAGPVKVRAINDVRQEVAFLREDERRKEAAADEAKRALHGASDRALAARHDLRRATSVKDKLVALAANVAEEAARDLQRKEDAEMEEASSVRRERQDWGDGHE